MILNPWIVAPAKSSMSVKAAWIWFVAWLAGLVLSTCLLLSGATWTLRTALVLILIALQLPVGIGLVQYAIWSNRHRLLEAWSLFLMIPPTLAVQVFWVAIVLLLDEMIRMDPSEWERSLSMFG